jgi:hypothetical protein
MPKSKVFISHSSQDKPFALTLVDVLKGADFAPWIDSEQILAGENLLREIGTGLAAMDVLVALISQSSLTSGWVEEELSFGMLRAIADRELLLLPFRIDSTVISELPWYLQTRLAPQVTTEIEGARTIANEIGRAVQRRARTSTGARKRAEQSGDLLSRPEVAAARKIEPGDLSSARRLAIQFTSQADRTGRNASFETLIAAVLASPSEPSDNAPVIGMCATVEACIELSPQLATRELLWSLGTHGDFSVRSSAAAICLDLAQFSPGHVATDLLFRLAVPDEDWYVDAPATAALLSLAHHQPSVLEFFYLQLTDSDSYTREHGAEALARIAKEEPEILDADVLRASLEQVEHRGDRKTASAIRQAIDALKRVKRTANPFYRYSL